MRPAEENASRFRSQELYSNRVYSQTLTKKTFFRYKICHNFKSIKSMKGNIPYICRPITFEDFR